MSLSRSLTMPPATPAGAELTGCPWHDVKAMLRQVGLRPTRQRMSLGWLGAPGKGRALGLGELKFSGQVLPSVKKIVYGIDFKRVMRSKLVLGIADGWLSADGTVIYKASDLKVGLFKQDEALQPSDA